jgi:hypothetical protein
MNAKKALTYCLLLFVAASVIMLTVKSFCSNTSSIEPALQNGLIVYYFHGNTRCPTCCSIESQTQDTVEANFASQLSSKEMAMQTINYEQPGAKQMVDKFAIQAPVVVLAKMKNNEIQDWKRLDEVWGLVNDKPGFSNFVQVEINRILAPGGKSLPAAAQEQGPKTPETNTIVVPEKERAEIPLPQ